MSEAMKLRAKLKWTIEKRKLDNAGQFHGIDFIDLDDEEFAEKVGSSDVSINALQNQTRRIQGNL